MAGKHGLFGTPSWLLPVLGGAAALATGGLGLGGLLGGGAADAAGAGAADIGAATAGDIGAGIGTGVGTGVAADTGLASSLLAAPAVGATGVSSAVTPLAADALAGAGDVTGLGAGLGTDIAASAAGLGDVAPGAGPALAASLTDAGSDLTFPALGGATAPVGAVTTSALPGVGATAAPDLAAGAGPSVATAVGSATADNPFFLPGSDTALAGGTAADIPDTGGTGLAGIWNQISGPLKAASTIGSAGLLIPQLFKGPQTFPEQKQLQTMAGNEVGIANQFLQPLQSGVLPPGAASAVDAAKAANTAAIVGADANLGISGSTMEAQQLQAVNNAAAGQTFQIADQLATNALPYSQLATSTTQDLLKTSMTEDADYQAALANFAKALAGLGGTSPTAPATAV